MDYDVFPNVLDYEGPPGMVLMRQPIAALQVPNGEQVLKCRRSAWSSRTRTSLG